MSNGGGGGDEPRQPGRRRFTDQERRDLLRQYLELPRGMRKAFVKQVNVEASLFSRWHWQLFSKPISARTADDPMVAPATHDVKWKRNRRGPGPNVRTVSRASYDEVRMQLAVCKGLLAIANKAGFLEHFLAVDPDEVEDVAGGDPSK